MSIEKFVSVDELARLTKSGTPAEKALIGELHRLQVERNKILEVLELACRVLRKKPDSRAAFIRALQDLIVQFDGLSDSSGDVSLRANNLRRVP